MSASSHAAPGHEHLDPAIADLLAGLLDLARATAQEHIEALEDRDAQLAPFALVHPRDGEEIRLVSLEDVAHHLADAHGTGRAAATLLARYRADGFAIVATTFASPDGSTTHPQRREVVRAIVGHEGGLSGSAFCELTRHGAGPRLTGFWETSA